MSAEDFDLEEKFGIGWDPRAAVIGESASGHQVMDVGMEDEIARQSNTPPTVTRTDPAGVHSAGVATGYLDHIDVAFSKEINSIDANAGANYELRDAGPNGIFSDGDDKVYALNPNYLRKLTN